MIEIKWRLGLKERKMKLRKRVRRVKNKKEGDSMLSEISLRLDMHNATAWGLKVAASGWGHQGDTFGYGGVGAQPTEPSSKGGADIQPLQVDETVSFDDIGGLSDHIDALKEMGADVLSKWVGEAERQLKLLFEEAQRNQPSIIFFDEIDGLAPVRSTKQEQIHNSIVSTLLALMDGLDSRGQVVLIGAINRIDAIDGALHQPGQFDREFVFSLPDCKARAEILKIHTRKWKNPLSEELRMELAATCMGYCGVDLKSLCTEAAINPFHKKYPQIYTSDDKSVIDLDSVKVEKHDFLEAMSTITPAAHRGATVQSRPLSPVIAPCLQGHLKIISDYISDIFYVVANGDKKDSLNDNSRHLAKLLGFPMVLPFHLFTDQDFYFVGRRVLAWYG
ncbi:hypothetical protein SUGI_0168600 [Cryptomeria japonica]|nr:hypothetical protein SUGI_0168600 [Cryptomeria japonica]